jgi:hypothetical protein
VLVPMISAHGMTRVLALRASALTPHGWIISSSSSVFGPALDDASEQLLHLPSSTGDGRSPFRQGRAPVHCAVDIAVDNFVDKGADRWRARSIP